MAYDVESDAAGMQGFSEDELREQMCEIGRRIWLRGSCAGNDGNHTVRIGPDRVLCTPTGMSKGFMKPGDMVIVDMEGRQVSGARQRTSEIFLHLAILKARPDMRCVIHNHPPHATAFALSGQELPCGFYPEAEWLLGHVPTAPYVMPGDHRLGDSVLPFVMDSQVILLQNHGVVCFDTDLERAYQKFEVVEQYARLAILTKQIGSTRMLSAAEMEELLMRKTKAGLADPRWKGTRS